MPTPLPATIGPWRVRQSEGTSRGFHHRDFDADELDDGHFRSTIWAHRPSRPALILGSTQAEEVVDGARASADGWEICRRRSGGGLVVAEPGQLVWVDVFVPPTHPAWTDDVGRAFEFVGRWWRSAIERVVGAQPSSPPGGSPTISMHTGPARNRASGRFLCFGGLGSGEVMVNGTKVVGLSQRRTRAGARFQTMVLLGSDTGPARTYGSAELRAAVDRALPHGWPADLERPTPEEVLTTFLQVAPPNAA